MSVNHYLLHISDEDLTSLINDPEQSHDLVKSRQDDIYDLKETGPVLTALLAEGPEDELAFLSTVRSPSESGWIGEYLVEDGREVRCQIDMGYGPPWYCRDSFVKRVAVKLREITEDDLKTWYDPVWLEEYCIYPPGNWEDPLRWDYVREHFHVLKDCVLSAADSGKNLLIWNGGFAG